MDSIFSDRTKDVAISIRKVREHKGYTQDYLAAKLKISQNAYSKLELGYSKLTVDRLFKIASILGIQAKDLVSLDYKELIKLSVENASLANV